jgi:DNA repair ATPase RecN
MVFFKIFFVLLIFKKSFDMCSLPDNVDSVSGQSALSATISEIGRMQFQDKIIHEDQIDFQELCEKIRKAMDSKGVKNAFLEIANELCNKSDKVSLPRKKIKEQIEIRRQKFALKEVKKEKMNEIKTKYEKHSQQFREFRKMKFKKLNQIKNQRKHEQKLMKNRQQKFAKQEVDIEQIRAK